MRLPAEAALVSRIARIRADMTLCEIPVTSVSNAKPPYPIASASAAAHKLRCHRSRYGRRRCHLLKTSSLLVTATSGRVAPTGAPRIDRSGGFWSAVDSTPVPRQEFIEARGGVIAEGIRSPPPQASEKVALIHFAAGPQPAPCGRQVSRGLRQSIPSSM
jgi:hypothetical protein